ncbi:uncharacterized protein TNCV_2562331 [Trichonephila clavipes]|uniref:Transposase n=1 Tax=Trichonephila clavipes TaxID=2585209 RepID=A0A8X6R100_TRICX|nr:uncharacterized protein TNCV_2562331 [Trichonephila clavipes]
MILAYGATDCNVEPLSPEVVRRKASVRRTPAHTMFARLHQQLCEYGSFQKAAPSVLFTDEASFFERGYFQHHNSHSWAAANPHVTRTRAAQDRFLVNVWAGILGDHLIGPYILPDRLTGPRYRILGTSFARVIRQCTLPLRLVLPCGSSKMEPPHISVFLFGITLDATCGER